MGLVSKSPMTVLIDLFFIVNGKNLFVLSFTAPDFIQVKNKPVFDLMAAEGGIFPNKIRAHPPEALY